MSDQSAPAESGAPAPEKAPTQEQSGPPEWLAPITSKLDELGETTSQLAEQYAQLQQPPPAEDEYEDEFAPDEFYDDDGEITEQGARHLIGSEVDERLSARLAERDAARALEEREDAFEALRDEVPALQDDKLAARLVHEAAAWCQQNNAEQLIGTPGFVDLIERIYESELYHERAKAEDEAEDEQEVVLESATGRSAARDRKQEPDWGERIVNAAQSLRPEI
jgi:hypothetical protein